MSLKFYYAERSTASVTSFVLDELETLHNKKLAERIKLTLQDGDTKKDSYLNEVNPNGCVPAIVHDGTSVWESAAITIYLGETFGVDEQKGIYPPPGPKRGEAMKWIVWANASLAPSGIRLYSDDKSQVDKAKESVGRLLSVLNGALEGKEFLLGEFTLADTHVWSFISWVTMLGVDLEEVGNVKAWVGRVGARPAIKIPFEDIPRDPK